MDDADQGTLMIPHPIQTHSSISTARPYTLPQTPVCKVKGRQSPRKTQKSRAYADMLSVLDSFMKLGPSGERITKMKDMLLSNIQQLENNGRIANFQDPLPPAVSASALESNVNPTPLDPLIMPRSGAK